MAKDACHCEEGLPEWIMSYADMITILMAFFVVMYSMAGTKDEKKEQAVFNSLRLWLGGTHAPWPDLHSRGGARTKGTGSGPRDGKSTIPVVQRAPSTGGYSLYFDGKNDELSATAQEKLREVVGMLAGKRHLIEIRGVPGTRPLPTDSPYKDPVDLTYAKCRQARDFLVAQGIEPQRIQLLVASRAGVGGAEDPQLTTHDARVDIMLLGQFLGGSKLSVQSIDEAKPSESHQ